MHAQQHCSIAAGRLGLGLDLGVPACRERNSTPPKSVGRVLRLGAAQVDAYATKMTESTMAGAVITVVVWGATIAYLVVMVRAHASSSGGPELPCAHEGGRSS